MAKKTFSVELKDVDGAVAAVIKAAKDNGIDFTGDSKKGSGGKAGAEISYVVSGQTVTVTVEDSMISRAAGWDVAKLEATIRDWLKPYQ